MIRSVVGEEQAERGEGVAGGGPHQFGEAPRADVVGSLASGTLGLLVDLVQISGTYGVGGLSVTSGGFLGFVPNLQDAGELIDDDVGS